MDFCLGPFEGCRLLVPTGDKGFDCLDEPADAGEVSAPQSATAKDAKPTFKTEQRMVQRARVILLAAGGMNGSPPRAPAAGAARRHARLRAATGVAAAFHSP